MKNQIYKYNNNNLKFTIKKLEKTGYILKKAASSALGNNNITSATPIFHMYPDKISIYHFYHKQTIPERSKRRFKIQKSIRLI
jgi:hypothetical protein